MHAKLTYIFVFAACLLSSCNADEPTDNVVLSKGAELSFDVSGLSRGSVATSLNHFTVYGDIRSVSDNAAAPIVLFDKTKVEYRNGGWEYDGIQYWIPNREHSFVAVSPESVLVDANAPRYSNSQLSFTYAIPAPGGKLTNNSDVTDILIATHRRFYGNKEFVITPEDKIAFKFGHVLSLLNIAPAFDDNMLSSKAYISFLQMELSGVKTKAKFDIIPASRLSDIPTDDRVVNVTGLVEGNLTVVFSKPVKVENNSKNVSLFADDDAIIMLPQIFAADSDAKITFSYTINDDPAIKQASLSLNSQEWESGKSYMYKFTVQRTGLNLGKCEINPWNDVVQAEDITVD